MRIPGKQIPEADTLSRNFLPDEQTDVCQDMDSYVHAIMKNISMSDQKIQLIKSKIESDSEMQLLKQTILNGWPDKRQECPKCLLPF